MTDSNRRAFANVLAIIGGAVVVAGHLMAGMIDTGHPSLHLGGESIVFALFGWILCVVLCIPALIAARGRSRAAIGALLIMAMSFLLAF